MNACLKLDIDMDQNVAINNEIKLIKDNLVAKTISPLETNGQLHRPN